MLKNKLLLFSLFFGLSSLPIFGAEVLSDVQFPKAPAYRVGISELPERQYVQAIEEKNKQADKVTKISDVSDANVTDLTYADLSIKRLSKEVAQELEFEEQDMLADLSLLWQGAAVQSDTINFALYKLANPDADKPDEKSLRNVLKTIASMSTLVGASMGSPLIAGSSLIGGNIFGIMSQDTKALNYKYTRVNDADMIILIRKVEDLQQRAVDLYYDYMSAKKQLEFANNLVEDRKRKFDLAQKNNAARELVVITDAYYRTALDKQRTAKSEFFSKRAALEQFVGRDTFLQFEAELAAREKGETTNTVSQSKEQTPEEVKLQEAEYQQTVENVKNYTENVVEATQEQKTEEPIIREVKEVIVEDVTEDIPQETSKKSNKLKFWEKKEKLQEEDFKSVEEVKVKQEKIKVEKPKVEKVKTEKIKKEKVVSPKIAEPKIKNEKLQPLEPITIKSYEETVLDIEKSLDENGYNTYDFSDAERGGIKYFGDPMYDGMTGLAANIDETSSKKSFLNKFKKKKQETEEKPKKEKKEKVDPKSTKNLIFLHGEDKQTAKSRFNFNVNGREIQQNTGEKSLQDVKPIQNIQQQINNEFNLPPLDEIRTPDLTRDGYSIHSEYMY
ncbi:hypothetical protein J6A34_03780 [bacterium]|nr:hypothetical protein [bacterium]